MISRGLNTKFTNLLHGRTKIIHKCKKENRRVKTFFQNGSLLKYYRYYNLIYKFTSSLGIQLQKNALNNIFKIRLSIENTG